MTKHNATHELSQAFADLELAEEEFQNQPIDLTKVLFHVRMAKSIVQHVVDNGIGKDLAQGDPMM